MLLLIEFRTGEFNWSSQYRKK